MLKRVSIFIIGVGILAFGVVLNTKTALGVPSISSVPFVLSSISKLTLGQATMLVYVLFILCQCLLLKKIRLKTILQIPFSLLFGLIVDLLDFLIPIYPVHFYQSIFYLFAAIITTSFGAFLVVSMDLVLNPADGIVNTIAKLTHREFGRIKLIFDCCLVTCSLVISWVFSHQFLGFGLGTIVSAIFIGQIITIFNRFLLPYLK